MREAVAAALARQRSRLWALCYRMTGSRTDADDLAQEAAARALEHAEHVTEADPTGWLLRLTTRVCLDHLRRRSVRRRLTELVDPIGELPDLGEDARPSAENALVLREDTRFAIVVALLALSARQRAAIVLRDVCDLPLSEVALALDTNANAVKALLHRGRVALAEARGRADGDVPTDPAVVERFARAVHEGSIEAIRGLLAEDVWGVADGGGLVVTANKPTFGRDVVSRQWENAKRKLPLPVEASVVRCNGEEAVLVRLREAPDVVVALVHLETRGGEVVAQRVLRDPVRLARLGAASGEVSIRV